MAVLTPQLADPLEMLVGSDLLTAEERDIQLTVRSFVDRHVRPSISDWFDAGHFPVELAPAMGELGLLGMHIDGYGCAGTNSVSYGLACMELEAGDSGLRSFMSAHGSLAMFAIARYGSEEQRTRWLPEMAAGRVLGCFGLTEPESGSDPGSMRTFARRDGHGWRLNGSKMWISNGGFANLAIVWAKTDEGIRGFIVPRETEGFVVTPITQKLSLRASVTSELSFDDCWLPDDALLPEAQGLSGPLGCLNEARFGIVFGALGAARDCLQTAITYSQDRTQFGKPIGSFQLTQQKLADMAVELSKGFLLAVHVGRLKDNGELTAARLSMAKLNNVREAIQIARTSRTILGANGITLSYPVLRHANNLESVLTYEGTSEVHSLVIGGALTGFNAFR
jgi:glutaryl-CoA dehydrogenase